MSSRAWGQRPPPWCCARRCLGGSCRRQPGLPHPRRSGGATQLRPQHGLGIRPPPTHGPGNRPGDSQQRHLSIPGSRTTRAHRHRGRSPTPPGGCVSAVQRWSQRQGERLRTGSRRPCPAAGRGMPFSGGPGQPARRSGQHHRGDRARGQPAGDAAAAADPPLASPFPLAAAGLVPRRGAGRGSCGFDYLPANGPGLPGLRTGLGGHRDGPGRTGYVSDAAEAPGRRGGRTSSTENPPHHLVPY